MAIVLYTLDKQLYIVFQPIWLSDCWLSFVVSITGKFTDPMLDVAYTHIHMDM